MKVRCELIQEELNLCGKPYIAYGIIARDKYTDTIIDKISDISSVRQELQKLVCMCNKLSLTPEQLSDIVEDFIAEH